MTKVRTAKTTSSTIKLIQSLMVATRFQEDLNTNLLLVKGKSEAKTSQDLRAEEKDMLLKISSTRL
jgi:hypothetical protein